MPGWGGCAQPETTLQVYLEMCQAYPPPPHPFWTGSMNHLHVYEPGPWTLFLVFPPPLPKKGKLRKFKLLINMMQIYLLFILVFYPLSHTDKFLHAAKVIYWVTWKGQGGMIQNESRFNCACVRKKQNNKKKKYPQSWANILLIIRITQPGCKQMYQTALCT